MTRLALLCASLLVLAGCQEEPFDIQSQIGPDPVLPEPQQYLLPPMRIAKVVGWASGEKPTVASGLKVEALATGLESPRNLYVLPNGDVLVVESRGPNLEPTTRPKDLIMGWIMSYAHGEGTGGNRITLLRDTNGDGVPDVRTVFLDNLFSPFGVALVGRIFTWPTPMPSSVTPMCPAKPRSPHPAPS
jgi:Glucose/sorbosone dehydrogenases